MQNRLLAAVFAAAILVFSACKKIQETSQPTLAAGDSTNPNALVLTPAGLMPRSHVHLIEKGYAVMHKNGHLYKVELASRNIIEDFGKIDSTIPSTSTTVTALKTVKSVSRYSGLPGYEASSWVTDAEWENSSGGSVTSFSADWVVPNAPASNDNQVLFIWNGIENSTQADVIQPVLQWGDDPIGFTGWVIANWYVWGPQGSGESLETVPVEVSSNTALKGTVTYTGQQSDGSYDYTSSFTDLSSGQPYDNALTIIEGNNGTGTTLPFIPEQVLAFEALEAYTLGNDGTYTYGVTQPSDYPANQSYVSFYNPVIAVNGATAGQSWTPQSYDTQWGESTLIGGPAPFGVVGATGITNYLYWHPAPTIANSATVRLTNTSTAYTISGTPGAPVTIGLTAYTLRPGGIKGDQVVGTTTDYLTMSTSGITFNNGSTSISESNGIAYYSFVMPASGTVTVTGYFTPEAAEPPLIQEVSVAVF